MSEEKAHAKFSASGSERWLKCPGSIALSKNAPPQVESKYATEGTLAHECLELMLTAPDPIKIPAKFDDDMVNHAISAAQWIKEQAGDDMLLAETRVDTSPFTCEGQFGTVDAAIVREFGKLTVIDYKYGSGILREPGGEDGKGDSQLIMYALGLSYQYHHNFSEVELVIIQPRAYHETGEFIRSVTYPMHHLLEWAKVFKLGVMACNQPKARLKAGGWCRFCPAGPICPEIKETAMRDAQIVFANNAIEAVPEPKLVPIPHLGRMLEACEKLETWIAKVRDHAEYILENGGEVDGYKLVDKRSIRKWVDKDAATKQGASIFGPVALCKPEILSPAQLEKAIGKAKVKQFIDQYSSNESSGTVMVKETDKRPSVNPAAQIFKDEPVNMIDIFR